MPHGQAPMDELPISTTRDVSHGLARLVQAGVPLERDPWGALGLALGCSAADVLTELQGWQASGHLREISGVLEGASLGWDSALCAATVAPDDLPRVAAAVSACPTVTHNYERDHEKNLWFTIAMPPAVGVDRALRALEHELAPIAFGGFAALRRTETFKIGVRFDPETLENATTSLSSGEPPPRLAFDAAEERLLAALQAPLPLVPSPFAALAERAGVEEGALLAFGRAQHGRALRRYVATFRHRRLGVRGNGMAVWRVDPARSRELGLALAAAPEVSHCYARTTLPDFPYSHYTMIHARDEAAVRAVADRLAASLGLHDRAVLFSTKEHKKVRLRYFDPTLSRWLSDRGVAP